MKSEETKKEEIIKPIENLEQAETEMLALVRDNASLGLIESELQRKVTIIFDKQTKRVTALESSIATRTERLKAFALGNKDNAAIFPTDAKTIKLMGGELQVNAGTPSIVCMEGFDDATVLLRIREKELKGLTRQPSIELNREAVMQQLTEKTLTPADLTAIGLTREQTEKAIVKPLSLDKLRKTAAKASAKSNKAAPKAKGKKAEVIA